MRLFNLIKFICSVFFFGFMLYGGYFVFDKFVWNAINPEPTIEEQFAKEVNKISNIEHFEDNVKIDTKKPFAMLLLGVDGNSFNSNRSDSVMIGIVNPKDEKVSLLSIPRDLRVKIIGENGYDKINAAFAKGGVDLTAATIEKLFGLPIEYYATINFKGFEEMVDAIGGINVDVEKDLEFSDRITKTRFSLEKGEQDLNGIEALNYARYRGDGEGDFGRMRRQQQVIRAIVDETVTFRNIPRIIDIIEVVDDNFNANVSYKDLGLLALKMRNVKGSDINTIEFNTKPDMINGISYVVVSDDEVNKVSDELQKLLKEN